MPQLAPSKPRLMRWRKSGGLQPALFYWYTKAYLSGHIYFITSLFAS
jgi:hypothetical protein